MAQIVPESAISTREATQSFASHPTAHRRWRDSASSAFHVVTDVLRNALGCILCAWLANFCYSLGNIFSKQSPQHQSTESLILASLVWTELLFCLLLLLTHTVMLLPTRHVLAPDKRPSALFWMAKLLRATYLYFAASLAAIVGWGMLIIDALPSHLRWLRLDFYVGTAILHIYSAGIDLATRQIFSEQTCEGQAHRQRAVRAIRVQQLQRPDARDRHHRESDAAPPSRARRRFTRVYVKTFPKALAAIFAGCYVQLVSHSKSFRHGAAVAAFAITSTVFKLLVQELAKVVVMRRSIAHIRFMCILVGVPTVLIDTQVRIVLLGAQSAQFATASSLLMAVTEIAMRAGKMVFLNFEIRRRKRAMERPLQRQRSRVRSFNRAHPPTTLRDLIVAQSSPRQAHQQTFEQWKAQRIDFHTAEFLADMYAEYIAIGCSASILYFFASHPLYHYGDSQTQAPVESSSSSLSPINAAGARTSTLDTTQLWYLVFQIGLEVVVDFVSCTLEIAFGAQFHSARKFSSFLALVFMTIAVVNIGMSSFLYLK